MRSYVLVGRVAEMSLLSEQLDLALNGNGRVVVLAGDPGVGKTRLVDEMLSMAAQRGFRTLRGVAGPHHDDVSYAPVVQVLRALLVPDELAGRGWLVERLPDLGRLIPGLPLPAPVALADASLERTRLFEAVWRLIERATARWPLIIVVDDLHWADPATLSLLNYLGRGLTGLRCVIIGTVRASERSERVSAFLASLRGDRLTELSVGPLERSAVAELVGTVLDGAPPPALLGLLHERARGVPLFVTSIVATLQESGQLLCMAGTWVLRPGASAGLPRDIADLLRSRMAHLGDDERAVLEAIAVCGDAATLEVLGVVAADDVVSGRVRLLWTAGFLIEEHLGADVVYRMVHPLLAEVVYADLLEPTRRTMHARAARAVRERWPQDVSRLAAHVGKAGSEMNPSDALEVLTAAAAHAIDRRAGEEGVRHAEAALRIAAELSRSDLVGPLLEQLAEAAELAGRPERAADAWLAAADEAPAAVDAARARRRAATLEWELGRFDAAQAHLGEAAELAATAGTDERAAVAVARLFLSVRTARFADARARTVELAELAEQGHPRAAALVAYLEYPHGDDTVAYERFIGTPKNWPALKAIEELGDPLLLAHVQRPWVVVAAMHGDNTEARRRATVALAHARTAGVPELELRAIIPCGWVEFQAGTWDAALRSADGALVIAHRIGAARDIAAALALRAAVQFHRGDGDAARRCIAEARRAFGGRDRHVGGTIDVVEALLALSVGDASQAVQVLIDVPVDTHVPVLAQQVRAQAHLGVGDRATVHAVIDLLRDGPVPSPYATAAADHIEALSVESTDRARATALLAQAVSGFDALSLPWDGAQARLALAELTLGHAAAEQAIEMFDALGARPAADRARQLLRRLGHRAAPPPRPSRARNALSPRETEVARLVAQGLTNSAVAERLFISPRTVTTHLDKIYRRLGVGTRTALARYVLEHDADT